MMSLDELLALSEPKLALVYPVLRARVKQVIIDAAQEGMSFGVHTGLRTWAEQDALYAQGRTVPGKKVTNARGGQSWHNFGLAVDLVEDGDPAKAGMQWSWSAIADYVKLSRIVTANGLASGGLWKSVKDYPHAELTGGLALSEARSLFRAGGLQAVWDKAVTSG